MDIKSKVEKKSNKLSIQKRENNTNKDSDNFFTVLRLLKNI